MYKFSTTKNECSYLGYLVDDAYTKEEWQRRENFLNALVFSKKVDLVLGKK